MANAHLESRPASIEYFDSAERERLDRDDTDAFSRVTMILFCIVSGGLMLGILSLLAIIATS